MRREWVRVGQGRRREGEREKETAKVKRNWVGGKLTSLGLRHGDEDVTRVHDVVLIKYLFHFAKIDAWVRASSTGKART